MLTIELSDYQDDLYYCFNGYDGLEQYNGIICMLIDNDNFVLELMLSNDEKFNRLKYKVEYLLKTKASKRVFGRQIIYRYKLPIYKLERVVHKLNGMTVE